MPDRMPAPRNTTSAMPERVAQPRCDDAASYKEHMRGARVVRNRFRAHKPTRPQKPAEAIDDLRALRYTAYSRPGGGTADASVSKTGTERCVGSNPTPGTTSPALRARLSAFPIIGTCRYSNWELKTTLAHQREVVCLAARISRTYVLTVSPLSAASSLRASF